MQLFVSIHRRLTSSGTAIGSARCLSQASRDIDVQFRTPEEENSRQSRRFRDEAKIPGLIYGAGEGKFPLSQTRKAIAMNTLDVIRHWRQLGRSIENTLFNVHVDDGTSYLCTPRQLQAHPISENPLAMNFLIYRPGSQVRVPVKFVNQEDCVDIKRGAFIVPVGRYLSITAEAGVAIPQTFDIDVTHHKKNKVFTVEDLVLPDGIHVHKKFDRQSAFGVIKGTTR